MGKVSITVPQASEDTGGYTLDITYPDSVYAVATGDEQVSAQDCLFSLLAGKEYSKNMWISPESSTFKYALSNIVRPSGGVAPTAVVNVKATIGAYSAWAVVIPSSGLFYTGWQNVPKSDELSYGIAAANFPINGDNVFNNAISQGHDYVTVSVKVGISEKDNNNPHENDTAVYSKSFTVKLMAPQSWVPSFDLAFLLSQTYGGKCYTNVSSVRYGVSNVAFPGGASLGAGSSVALNGVSTQVGSLPFENVIALVPRSGVNEVTATIVDSRGRSTTKTATFVAEYPPSPTIGEMAVSRCLADGTRDDDGGFVRIDFEVSGSDSPPVELDYIYVEVLDASGGVFGFDDVQGLAPSLSLSSNLVISGVGNGETATNLALSPNEQYSVTLTVKGFVNDELRNGTVVRRCLSSKTVILPRAFRLMDCLAGGRGVAFGAPATEEGFLCAMESTFDPPIPNSSLDAAPRAHVHDGSGIADGAISWGKLAGALQATLNDSKFSSRAGSSDLNALMSGVNTWDTSTKNIPVASTWGIVVTFANGTDPESSGLWRRQIAMDTSGRTFTRQCINRKVSENAGWTAWQTLWVSGSAVPVSGGGTGSSSAAGARTNLGISNCVTAEGNSGIWHYRKYSNGYAEAWGSATFTPSGMTNDNWRWLSTSHASTQSLPFTFKKVMTADVSYNNPAIFSVIGVANASGTYTSINATKIQYWCISAVAVATPADAYIYVCGTY